MEETIFGADSMVRYATAFVRTLVPGKTATVVGLAGDLGAGKTTFIQGAAKSLGIEESVTSPTFVIEKIYPLVDQPFAHLIHIDAYRLKSADELVALGWGEIIRDPRNVIFIEWPERVSNIMPADAKRLKLRFIDEKTRGIERVSQS